MSSTLMKTPNADALNTEINNLVETLTSKFRLELSKGISQLVENSLVNSPSNSNSTSSPLSPLSPLSPPSPPSVPLTDENDNKNITQPELSSIPATHNLLSEPEKPKKKRAYNKKKPTVISGTEEIGTDAPQVVKKPRGRPPNKAKPDVVSGTEKKKPGRKKKIVDDVTQTVDNNQKDTQPTNEEVKQPSVKRSKEQKDEYSTDPLVTDTVSLFLSEPKNDPKATCSSDNEGDEDGTVSASRFTYENRMYLRDTEDIIYDCEMMNKVGTYDKANNTIVFDTSNELSEEIIVA